MHLKRGVEKNVKNTMGRENNERWSCSNGETLLLKVLKN